MPRALDTTDEQTPNSTPPEPVPERVEMVRKVYASALRDKDKVNTVFRVSRKQKAVSRNGKPFLTLVLIDKTGEVDARVFEEADKADAGFAAGDYLLVAGHVVSFHGKPQLVIEQLERLDPEPIDPAEFTPSPDLLRAEAARSDGPRAEGPRPSDGPREGAAAVAQIRELCDRVHDAHVRQLLLAVLDDAAVSRELPRAAAAKAVHHAYRGGLAEHLLSAMRLANRIADHYPMADRDLLLAGAMLHDIGKVRELESGSEISYTDEGRLVGHLVIGAQLIHEKASRIPGFPALLEHHLTHLVLAHHGALEHGSPKLPSTLEALLVHLVDLMDSRVHSWLEQMARDPNERWTSADQPWERHLWKAPTPTSRDRGPLEGRPRRPHRDRHPERRRGQKSAAPATAPSRPPPEAAEKTAAPAEPAKPRDPGLPEGLAFKPFSAIAGPSGTDPGPDSP